MIQNKRVMGKRIGLTGGIGTGKSTVSDRLRALGATVLNADAISREVVEPGEKGLEQLIARYGTEILLHDGTLNRKKLADIIFASDAERTAVNAILHPLVTKRMLDKAEVFARQYKNVPLFLEIPLLFETGMHRSMDEVWLVTADEQARVKRVMERDHCTKDDALKRIKSQMPQEEQQKYTHKLLDNSGDMHALCAKVDALYASLMHETEK